MIGDGKGNTNNFIDLTENKISKNGIKKTKKNKKNKKSWTRGTRKIKRVRLWCAFATKRRFEYWST